MLAGHTLTAMSAAVQRWAYLHCSTRRASDVEWNQMASCEPLSYHISSCWVDHYATLLPWHRATALDI